jgi:hypothetical protein
MTMKFGGKQTMSDKMKVAERYAPTNALAKTKAPSKPKVTAGLMGKVTKPKGVKVKVEQKFSSGKWVK